MVMARSGVGPNALTHDPPKSIHTQNPTKKVPDELRPAAGNAALLRLAHPLPLAPPPPPASAAAAAPVDGDWSAGEVEALMVAAVGA